MKDAFTRALRTAAQTLAGALVALPTVSAVTDLKAIGDPFLIALWTAFLSGVVAFLHNATENATGTPKA